MRTINDHKVGGLNEDIHVVVLDEPGCGGACHRYQIDGPPHYYRGSEVVPEFRVDIRFQEGPIGEVGVNGISQEALLAVVIDRLRGFQSGEFKCRENAIALTKLEEGLMWMQKRTQDRLNRGVEGKSVV